MEGGWLDSPAEQHAARVEYSLWSMTPLTTRTSIGAGPVPLKFRYPGNAPLPAPPACCGLRCRSLSQSMTQDPQSAAEEQQRQLGDPSGQRSSDYWDEWFKLVSRGDRFEWYCSTEQVERLLMRQLRDLEQVYVFHAGNGNSEVPFELCDRHQSMGRALVFDCSAVAIAEMEHKKRERGMYQGLHFLQGDIFEELPCEDDSFDAWLDKGMIDAIMGECNSSTVSECADIFRSASRVLKPGGLMLIITLAEPYLLDIIASVLAEQRCWGSLEVAQLQHDSGSPLQPFGLSLTKRSHSDANGAMSYSYRNQSEEVVECPSLQEAIRLVESAREGFGPLEGLYKAVAIQKVSLHRALYILYIYTIYISSSCSIFV